MDAIVKRFTARLHVVFFFSSVSLFVTAFLMISSRLLHSVPMGVVRERELHIYPQAEAEFSALDCTAFSRNETCCPTRGATELNFEEDQERREAATCPEYFRWIHEDLRRWARTGITTEMLERARAKADFRLVIVGGRAYVEKYADAYQTRDVFTLWGILQLLRWYPGKIPDLDLMFHCGDQPNVFASDYSGPDEPNESAPPPLFRYCGDDDTLGIVFPDWSFWGWPEINIKPWIPLLKDLKQGNQRTKWINREPYAYWKGNTFVSMSRYKLLKCNVSSEHDWNLRVYMQNWQKEIEQGFKDSNLADQCVHRYKVYVEGVGWSVSLKYILACDSVTLMVKPHYYDFFMRSLVPMRHYWPIKDDDMCKSIKFAVDWSNTHKEKAQAIGKAGSKFIEEQLSMEKVYDYMFHSLNEYSKLLTFKPTIPPNATQLCLEQLACPAQPSTTKFMMDSLVKRPSFSSPCSLLPPFSPAALNYFRMRKETPIKQVEMWEKNVSFG